MDSLLANYASSSDEEADAGDDQPTRPPTSSSSPPAAAATTKPSPSPSPSSSLFSSLPPPKSLFSSDAPPPSHTKKASLFSSLPPPKSADPTQRGSLFSSLPPPQLKDASRTNPSRTSKRKEEDDSFEEVGGEDGLGSSSASASIFSSLPPPKSKDSLFTSIPALKPEPANSVSLKVNTKKVVQFTPPIINPSLLSGSMNDEDEEDNKKDSVVEPSFNPSSILSSMLPAPKNSLCLAPPSNSSNLLSRKSNLDTQLPAVSTALVQQPEPVQYDTSQSYDPYWAGNVEQTGYVETSSSGYATDYGNAEAYGGYEGYNWSADAAVGSSTGASVAMEVHDLGRARGKRGRNDKPPEIVEVKRDELMKNRPRQDQAKLTGIAFGPSYQPTPSAKEKPSKLHKRKHQIGALYFDMRQKEMELAERRAKGFLTKAETQAKYGW